MVSAGVPVYSCLFHVWFSLLLRICFLLLGKVSIRDVPLFCYFLLYFGNLGHVHLVGFFTLLPLFCLVILD